MWHLSLTCPCDIVPVTSGTYIQDVMMDEDETILAVMQDGEVIPAIDVDPDQSTHDIQMWIDMNPTLHERVLMLMEAQ